MQVLRNNFMTNLFCNLTQFSQFAAIEAYAVMPEDSVASSHPIIVPVNRPEEITAVFDSISYNKVLLHP